MRTRTKSVAGLIELLIPLLIAALTVFNTMRSSVYERKEEIYVYNAVGIAPNHIFFMFMAEACVYAVIGAMAGYLLSQVVMTVLTLSCPHLVQGLNMDYSSIETIYASLAIVASVLLSTLLPAHTASRLALPSDEASWTVPRPDGDIVRFNLPFTFGAHDRVAIISYFYRWLDANGEGSSGPFFCAPPRPCTDTDERETRIGGMIPAIEADHLVETVRPGGIAAPAYRAAHRPGDRRIYRQYHHRAFEWHDGRVGSRDDALPRRLAQTVPELARRQ